MSKKTKLEVLAEVEGMTIDEMLSEATFDSIAKAICTNPGCDYTTDMEPDQDAGYCEECKTQTVKACTVLAGII